jgi:hypothetical protein
MLHDNTVVWSSRIIMPQSKKKCQELNTQTYSTISQKNTHIKAVTAQKLTVSFSQIIINPTEVYAMYIIQLFLGQRVGTDATYCLHLTSYIKFIWHTLNCCLLGYDTVGSSRSEMTFRRILLPPSSPWSNEFIPKEQVSPKHWSTSTRIHGVTFQKNFHSQCCKKLSFPKLQSSYESFNLIQPTAKLLFLNETSV